MFLIPLKNSKNIFALSIFFIEITQVSSNLPHLKKSYRFIQAGDKQEF